MKTEDVARAMKWYDARPVHGLGGDHEVRFKYVAEAEVFSTEDDLAHMPSAAAANDIPLDLNPEPTLSGKNTLESPKEIQQKIRQFLSASWLSIEGIGQDNMSLMDFPHQNNLSPPLREYYSIVTTATLGNNDETFQVSFYYTAIINCR